MDLRSPLGGNLTESGIWLPGVKSDRSQASLASSPHGGNYGGILAEGARAPNKFRDLSSYLGAVKSVPWIWSCVSVIAYTFANNEYQYLDADGDEVTDDFDPFLRLWERPNPGQSGFHFRELMMHYLQLTGETFISLEEWDGQGLPHEMYLPNPARMRVVQSRETGGIIGYEYDPGGQATGGWRGPVPYTSEEIIHIKYANPLDELRGLGAVEAAEMTLNIMAEMSGTELSYWKSGGRITGVLQTESQVDDLSFEKLVQRWREFTASSSRDRSRFKTAVLEQGLKYQPIAEGLRGIDMVKLENSKREAILAAFGVPLQKLGVYDAATGYKADDADRFFFGETIEPILSRVEDGLVPLIEIFSTDNLFRFARRNYEDDTVKLNNAKIMQSLGFTLGEIFAYLGLDPPDDVRRDMIMPAPGATPLTLSQLKTMSSDTVEHPLAELRPPPKPPALPPHPGQLPLAGTQPSATGTENGRSGRVDQQGHLPNAPQSAVKGIEAEQAEEQLVQARSVWRQRRRDLSAKGLARLNSTKALMRPRLRAAASLPATGEVIRRATAAIRFRITVKHRPKVRAAFEAQRRALTPVLKDALAAFKALETTAERRAWLRERWPEAPLAAALTALHVEAANDGWRLGKRALGFTGKDAEWEVKADETGVEEFVSPTLASLYDRLPGRRITGVNDTTIKAVEAIVSEGIRRGYSALQVANGVVEEDYAGVASIFDDEYRAEEVARTEGMFAANFGLTSSYVDSGLSQAEALDGTDDPECAERDGQLFELDPDAGRPVDDAGDPVEDHPNGTLAWAPSLEGADLVSTGALDDTGPVAEWEPAGPGPTLVDGGELGAEWEVKYGTGQDNNPEGHNQWAEAIRRIGERAGPGARRGRHGSGGGGGGGGGRGSGTAAAKPKKDGGKGRSATHRHANGVRHTHAGGAKQHSHSTRSRREKKEIFEPEVKAKEGDLDALLDYWRGQMGGGQGEAGDFDACVAALSKHPEIDNPEALCAWLHHEVTGAWPGHAPAEEEAKYSQDQPGDDSRAVSAAEFQSLAQEGKSQLAAMQTDSSPPAGLDKNWDEVKQSAYQKVQKSWGGITIDAHTGQPLQSDADKYALTVREGGQGIIAVDEKVTYAQFEQAMAAARSEFGGQLSQRDHYLGVFHDDENHRIDIDPVVVVASTHAVGGAYHFASGNGYFPPHVKGAIIHFDSIARWHAQAVKLQGIPVRMVDVKGAEVKYSPDQPRDYHGRWGLADTALLSGGKPPIRLVANDEAEQRLLALYQRSQAAGMAAKDGAWYQAAHDQIGGLAQKVGVDQATMTGMVAATSPQTPWDYTHSDRQPNLEFAARAATYSDMFPDKAPHELTSELEHPGTLRANLDAAITIYRGADPADVLAGPKVRSFYNNLLLPDHPGDVTIDTHMARAMLDDPRANDAATSAVTEGTKRGGGGYGWAADRVRSAARTAGVSPHEFQAATWSEWQREHP